MKISKNDRCDSAIRHGWPIYLAKGEAKADRLKDRFENIGFLDVAVSSYGGQSIEGLTATLKGARYVLIVPDRNKAGQQQAQSLISELRSNGVQCFALAPTPLLNGADRDGLDSVEVTQ